MAFLTAGAPGTTEDELGPYGEVEYSWGFSTGFVWSQKKRTIRTYRCWYLCDDTGGESPSATWLVGADTFNLRTYGPELQYRDNIGLYLAVYEHIGSWAWV